MKYYLLYGVIFSVAACTTIDLKYFQTCTLPGEGQNFTVTEKDVDLERIPVASPVIPKQLEQLHDSFKDVTFDKTQYPFQQIGIKKTGTEIMVTTPDQDEKPREYWGCIFSPGEILKNKSVGNIFWDEPDKQRFVTCCKSNQHDVQEKKYKCYGLPAPDYIFNSDMRFQSLKMNTDSAAKEVLLYLQKQHWHQAFFWSAIACQAQDLNLCRMAKSIEVRVLKDECKSENAQACQEVARRIDSAIPLTKKSAFDWYRRACLYGEYSVCSHIAISYKNHPNYQITALERVCESKQEFCFTVGRAHLLNKNPVNAAYYLDKACQKGSKFGCHMKTLAEYCADTTTKSCAKDIVHGCDQRLSELMQ